MTVKSNSFFIQKFKYSIQKENQSVGEIMENRGGGNLDLGSKIPAPNQTKPKKSKKNCQFNSRKTNVFNYTNL